MRQIKRWFVALSFGWFVTMPAVIALDRLVGWPYAYIPLLLWVILMGLVCGTLLTYLDETGWLDD